MHHIFTYEVGLISIKKYFVFTHGWYCSLKIARGGRPCCSTAQSILQQHLSMNSTFLSIICHIGHENLYTSVLLVPTRCHLWTCCSENILWTLNLHIEQLMMRNVVVLTQPCACASNICGNLQLTSDASTSPACLSIEVMVQTWFRCGQTQRVITECLKFNKK